MDATERSGDCSTAAVRLQSMQSGGCVADAVLVVRLRTIFFIYPSQPFMVLFSIYFMVLSPIHIIVYDECF